MIIKVLNFRDVRKLCIDYDLYTNGYNNDYNRLQYDIDNCLNVSDDDLYKFAKDIYEHSIEYIMTLLNSKIIISIV